MLQLLGLTFFKLLAESCGDPLQQRSIHGEQLLQPTEFPAQMLWETL